MKKIILFLLFLSIFIFSEDYKHILTVECENLELLNKVRIASFKFITGGEKFNDVRILDENKKECEILSFSSYKNEIEVIFQPTDSLTYEIFIGSNSPAKSIKNLKKGEILIDDYLPPSSTKSGLWQWEKKSLSGIYSNTDKEGYSFHRVTFPFQYPVKPDDKIVSYIFIEKENAPEEIIVEIIARYRRHYYFSFGEDRIRWKGLNKTKLGEIPERGKWVKVEIPLVSIKEKNIEGIGFYHDKGKVYWDRISLNYVPVKMKIKKVFDITKNEFIPYPSCEIRGPYELKGNKFHILNLSPSISDYENLTFKIDGREVENLTEIKIPYEKKEIELKLTGEKKGEKKEFGYKINLLPKKAEEIKINFNFLPFSNFVYENEVLYLPVRIENISNFPLNVEIVSQKNSKYFLLPGKENGKTVVLDLFPKNNISVQLGIFGEIFKEKIIEILNPDEKCNFIDDGVFLRKNEDTYIVFRIPDYKNNQPLRNFSRIVLIGDFPLEIITVLKEKGFDLERYEINEEKFGNYLFSEFKGIREIIDKIKEDDFIIFFPFLSSLLRRHKIEDWVKVYDAILYLLHLKTSSILVISPFPSYPHPEIFLPYKENLKKIAQERDFLFLDIYEIFSEIPNSERYFKVNDYVFKNFPDKDGMEIIVEKILEIIKNEESFSN